MRHGHVGRAAGRRRSRRRGRPIRAGRLGGDLTDPAGVVRPAVESALAVARAGLTADPVVPPPPALRPYLNFARLSGRSLDVVARVVDSDDDFRARVARAVTETQVGRAGWLWLKRPDGWADELAELEGAWSQQQADEADERRERTATRKLAAAQAAVARAEADATRRLAELDRARDDLAGERAARTAAEARAAEWEAQAAQAMAARSDVVRKLKETESRLVERATELNAARARIRALQAEAAELAARTGEAVGDMTGLRQYGAGAAGRAVDAARARNQGAGGTGGEADAAGARQYGAGGVGDMRGSGGDEPEASPAPAATEGGLDVGQGAGRPSVAREVARAAGGAAALAEALAALAQALVEHEGTRLEPGVDVPAAPAGEPAAAGGGGAPTDVEAEPEGEDAGADARLRREPVALPGGMFDDTVEAAEHLLRTPGAVLVVDGYNVTMEGWPELAAADQRRRLVAAVSDLAARTATRVELVFDGAAVEPRSVPTPRRPLVRVRFSEPGVEADDVIIDLVRRTPAATPIIVASSDHRVRDGSRRCGANLLHARQLVAVLRR